jgi:hypothetical protein
MLSANKYTLTISSPICITFINSSYLIALARNSRTMLNRSRESRYPCLILTLGEMISIFSIKYDAGYRLVIYSLYNVEVHSF